MLHHADMMLADVYEAFHLPVHPGGGGGVFTVALVLLCLVDALSKHVDADAGGRTDRWERFAANRLRWPMGRNAIAARVAARTLQTETRNQLVHVAGVDDGRDGGPAPGRPKDIIIGKWGPIPPRYHDIELIDAKRKLPEDWPIFFWDQREDGPRQKLALAPFYWSIKTATQGLIDEYAPPARRAGRRQ